MDMQADDSYGIAYKSAGKDKRRQTEAGASLREWTETGRVGLRRVTKKKYISACSSAGRALPF